MTVGASESKPASRQAASASSIPAGGDQTLVIPPAANPEQQPAPGEQQEPAPEEPSAPQPDIGSDNSPLPADLPPEPRRGPLPYLGVGVMYTVSSADGQQVNALKVISVDPGSPAARAGLNIGTPASTIGASTQTAGQLLGPLDAALRPLLAKSGQLGTDGDLIVAIDDHRITAATDLRDRLAQLHPGDVIYLTVLRQQRDGSYKTVKLPATLGFPPNVGKAAAAR
ncbi:MAG TPA: PDZ domain-containing protein [Candidatus Binataceae bacterium]|nr:PDZ domain-containing protein [Candidatus Binataceae bacterium]